MKCSLVQVIICLILGFSLSATAEAKAKTKNKASAGTKRQKKIVSINLESAKAPPKVKTIKKSDKKLLIEVAFGSTTSEGEVEPLAPAQKAKAANKRPKSEVQSLPEKKNVAQVEGRKVASRDEPLPPPSLKNLLQKYEKAFEAEIEE